MSHFSQPIETALIRRNKQRINILFVILQMEMGGSERIVYNLANRLDRELFNPSVAWFYGDSVLEEFKALGIPSYHVSKGKRIDFSAMKILSNIMRNNDIHLVNAHHFMPMVYSFHGCKIRNSARLIFTAHSKWEIEDVPWRWRKIGSFLLNHTDAAIGVSTEVSKAIKETFGVDTSKLFTIQNGIDLESFAKKGGENNLKEQLRLTNDEKVIGIVANFRKNKNHILLLRAFSELIKSYKEVKLLLIGQGFSFDPENSEEEIRSFVDKNSLKEKVLFLGYRSDVPELLSIMDIFCLTSFKEGLPVSLIEAMASGLPVVGTDVEGIRDVIIPQRNGFLVSINDVDGLKNVLLTLLTDESLRYKFDQESRSLARDTYSLDRCIKQYQDLFLSVMQINRKQFFE